MDFIRGVETAARGAAAGLTLTGAAFVGGADTAAGEFVGSTTIEAPVVGVGSARHTELDLALGCVTVMVELDQAEEGTQDIPPSHCNPDPAVALEEAARTARGGNEQTSGTAWGNAPESGVVTEEIAKAPAVQSELQEAQHKTVVDRNRTIGRNALLLAGASSVIGWGRWAAGFISGKFSRRTSS